METLNTELRILASLLGAPDMDAKEAVQELAAHYDWLRPAADELEILPLGEWQAEHTRLFISGYPTTPCPPFESAYLSGPEVISGFFGLYLTISTALAHPLL
jgi:TorA maturation chaperone TorD